MIMRIGLPCHFIICSDPYSSLNDSIKVSTMQVLALYNQHQSISHKNQLMSSVAMWMDLEIMLLSEVGQKENDRYHIYLESQI